MTGCTQKFYKGWADKQVFGIIGSKKQIVTGADDETLLSVTPPLPAAVRHKLMVQPEGSDFLGKRAFIEKGARVLTLADALDFSVHRNRAYLTRKEVVYLQALASDRRLGSSMARLLKVVVARNSRRLRPMLVRTEL
jgi:hypothetical protein